MTKVGLSPDTRKAERLLRSLQDGRVGPPQLLLNDHCQQCEFRRRCREQAVREDSLSLLGGMGEKEVRGHARKGILTLTQLAHTFRPRRKGKRAAARTHPPPPACPASVGYPRQASLRLRHAGVAGRPREALPGH